MKIDEGNEAASLLYLCGKKTILTLSNTDRSSRLILGDAGRYFTLTQKKAGGPTWIG